MKYHMRLYVSGSGGHSKQAIRNLEALCEASAGEYEIEVIDVLEEPERAELDKIMATPTLIKTLPPPVRKLIGDLSTEHKVLLALDLYTIEDDD